jgi:hypothetical protein
MNSVKPNKQGERMAFNNRQAFNRTSTVDILTQDRAVKVQARQEVKPLIPNGVLFEKKWRQNVMRMVEGQPIQQSVTLDAVTGAVVGRLMDDSLYAAGTSIRFHEPYCTIIVRYAPGKHLRLTGFSQHAPLIKAVAERSTKEQFTITATGEIMTGYGLNVRELSIEYTVEEPVTKDGETPEEGSTEGVKMEKVNKVEKIITDPSLQPIQGETIVPSTSIWGGL